MTQTIDMISNEIVCNNDWTKYAKYFINDVGYSSKKSLKYNNNFNIRKNKEIEIEYHQN